MQGICSDGPAQGWLCDNLPKPAPRTLLVPGDIEEYMPGTDPRRWPPGTEAPVIPDDFLYRFEGMTSVEHATVPGAPEAAALYVHDASLDPNEGHMPSLGDWRYSEQPTGSRS